MDIRTLHTRREVLGGIAGVAALVALRPALTWAAVPVTLDEFMELSEALTDNEFSLRDQVGAQYQAAIDPAALRKLVDATKGRKTFNEILQSGALNDAANAATAQQILTYWYSGLVNNTTADYLEALAWESLVDGDLATVSSEPYGFPKWESGRHDHQDRRCVVGVGSSVAGRPSLLGSWRRPGPR
jgi:hypothetical protein